MRPNTIQQSLRSLTHRVCALRRASSTSTHFGQPLHETHPHLLKPGELTPGITSVEYHDRRSRFAQSLPDNSVAVLAAADLKYKSGAVFYEYSQNSDFFYLTGFNEPDSLAVIREFSLSSVSLASPSLLSADLVFSVVASSPSHIATLFTARSVLIYPASFFTSVGKTQDDYSFHLYVRPKDPHAESWDGIRSGIDAARDVFNADESQSIDTLHRTLPTLLSSAHEIYTNLPCEEQPPPTTDLLKALSRGSSSTTTSPSTSTSPLTAALSSLAPKARLRSSRNLINNLRSVKSPAEIAVMRRAGQESGRVITQAMRDGPFASERELWTYLEGAFRMHGLDGSAYLPVVAGGSNGLMIHYVRNDHLLRPDSMLLVDAGGQLGNYAADITRTWPQSRRFSPAQRDLYQTLLDVQRSCISLCRQDANTSLDGIHKVADAALRRGLKALGFEGMDAPAGSRLGGSMGSSKGLEVLFPHHVGHHVGLDVHDFPGIPRSQKLVAGNCITIEPGIYVPDDDRWPKHFRGMAMRIEDSVAITEEHPYVLTTEAVKEIADIEGL